MCDVVLHNIFNNPNLNKTYCMLFKNKMVCNNSFLVCLDNLPLNTIISLNTRHSNERCM